MRKLTFTFLLTLFIFISVKATTWNEPWHDEVIKSSDSFVKAKIRENKGRLATAEVIKHLGGSSIPAQFNISGYLKLQLTSYSSGDEGLPLPFDNGDTYYLFLRKSEKDNSYQIATPTSGFALLKEGFVTATYRHSYHRALVPEEVYEKTMTSIFLDSKGKEYDKNYIESFIKEQLSLPVSELSEDVNAAGSKRFFLQHVALESIYHLGVAADLKMLIPFLESKGYHAQISASRAISRINSPQAKEALMKFIEGKGFGFAKVMSIWGLKRLNAKEMKPRLETFLKSGKDEETGFGGSIMDPRVGTFFPSSVKESVKALLTEWKS
jgi:hypothetical protein